MKEQCEKVDEIKKVEEATGKIVARYTSRAECFQKEGISKRDFEYEIRGKWINGKEPYRCKLGYYFVETPYRPAPVNSVKNIIDKVESDKNNLKYTYKKPKDIKPVVKPYRVKSTRKFGYCTTDKITGHIVEYFDNLNDVAEGLGISMQEITKYFTEERKGKVRPLKGMFYLHSAKGFKSEVNPMFENGDWYILPYNHEYVVNVDKAEVYDLRLSKYVAISNLKTKNKNGSSKGDRLCLRKPNEPGKTTTYQLRRAVYSARLGRDIEPGKILINMTGDNKDNNPYHMYAAWEFQGGDRVNHAKAVEGYEGFGIHKKYLGIYDTLSRGCKENNLDQANAYKTLTGEKKHTKGIWFKYVNEKGFAKNGKALVMLDSKSGLITGISNSISQMARLEGISVNSISNYMNKGIISKELKEKGVIFEERELALMGMQ